MAPDDPYTWHETLLIKEIYLPVKLRIVHSYCSFPSTSFVWTLKFQNCASVLQQTATIKECKKNNQANKWLHEKIHEKMRLH